MSKVKEVQKKRRHRCEKCGLAKDSVKKRVNPFLADVHDEKKEQWLCDECYQELSDDI